VFDQWRELGENPVQCVVAAGHDRQQPVGRVDRAGDVVALLVQLVGERVKSAQELAAECMVSLEGQDWLLRFPNGNGTEAVPSVQAGAIGAFETRQQKKAEGTAGSGTKAPVTPVTIKFLTGPNAGSTIPYTSVGGAAKAQGLLHSGWKFDNGREFPGAQGKLALAAEPFRDKPVLSLYGDFTKGGNYVQAAGPLPGSGQRAGHVRRDDFAPASGSAGKR
jgi:hypothetical protein